MSVRVMTWVFEHSRSKKNARLVLLAIADCANDEGRQAYPSMPKLQQKTGLGERAVTSLVADLEKLGELEVRRNAGPKGCNLYRVVMTPQNLHPADSAGVAKEDTQVKKGTPANPAPPAESAPPQKTTATPAESAPGTIKEPSKTSSSKKSSRTAKPRRRIPDDFVVTEPMIAWAREHTPLVGAAETAQFIDWHTGKGTTMADWVAAWRTWMRKAQADAERNRARASPQGAKSSAPEQIPESERCPRHRDQRARNCRHCRADRLGGDA